VTVSAETFAYVADLVRRSSAIRLDAGKEYLVESRLAPLARTAGVPDVDAYVTRVRRSRDVRAHDEVVEAMTTNETSWFRDVGPFAALRERILPNWTASAVPGSRLRVWSAACSTGQEPYSIAMVLADSAVRGASILATDLSTQVLERARQGTYTQLEVNRGLPAPMLVRHLTREGAGWQVADELRRAVTFQRHNLLDPAPRGGPFDVVFLRNVLIYFDLEDRRGVLERVHRVLRPGGWLLLGAAETPVGVHDGFERVVVGRTTAYRATASSPAAAPVPTTLRGAP